MTRSQTLCGRACPRVKSVARRGARFRGWGREGGRALRTDPTADRHPSLHLPLLALPPLGEERGRGPARPLPIPGRFGLADFPPADPTVPAFASRILGGLKSLRRPLNMVFNLQPPRRRESAGSVHVAPGAAPTPHRPCPGLRLARWVKIPNRLKSAPARHGLSAASEQRTWICGPRTSAGAGATLHCAPAPRPAKAGRGCGGRAERLGMRTAKGRGFWKGRRLSQGCPSGR